MLGDSHAIDLYDDQLAGLVHAGARRIEDTLTSQTPGLAEQVLPWMKSLTRTGALEDYFTQFRRFPMLLIPWWAAGPERSGDLGFHGDVVYSTMNGYYYIRLIDDLVDRRGEPGLDLLPVAAVFHTEFQSPYFEYFPHDSVFWNVFRTSWLEGVDAGAVAPPVFDIDSFRDWAGRLLGAVLTPLAAVCERSEDEARFDRWRPVVLDVCRLEQLLDDTLDWHHDAEHRLPNLLLSEATRRGQKADIPLEWVVDEGYRWALETADSWNESLRADVAGLGCEPLERFVEQRAHMIADLRVTTDPGLRELSALKTAFDQTEG